MRLFRAPYFGDAEPTTADELGPALTAQQSGYLNVGLHVDTGGLAAARRRRDRRASCRRGRGGQCRALGPDRPAPRRRRRPRADGGGAAADHRRAARARLPLRAGLGLAGLTDGAGDAARSPGADLLAVRPTSRIFLRARRAQPCCSAACSLLAIALGIARALALTGARRCAAGRSAAAGRRSGRPLDLGADPRLQRGAGDRGLGPPRAGEPRRELEVIVIDDGSTDAHQRHRRRRLRRRAAGAAADPRQWRQGARAEPRPRAGARRDRRRARRRHPVRAGDHRPPRPLVRRPGVGAVAGNAKVGNRVNLVTRWQAVEYVTAQNLERRALAGLGAITVVPGAVGAWRRAALDAVGGFPVDTLAEDQDLTIADPARRLAGRQRSRGGRLDRGAGELRARSPGSASAGRSGRCNACGSTARSLREGRPRGLARSACRRPGCSRSCSRWSRR